MTDDVKALLAEARQAAQWAATTPGFPQASAEALDRALDALEAAQVPATDDEQEALAREITAGMNGGWDDYEDVSDEWREKLLAAADRALRAGFRRSSRVPVSRDELDEALRVSLVAPSGQADYMQKHFDIYPKADRKAADSGEAGQ